MTEFERQEPNPDNPWYRTRHTEHGKFGSPGELLPKRWLRPFNTSDFVSLDDKRLVQEGVGKKDILGFLSGFSFLVSGGVGAIWFVAGPELSIDLYISVAALLLGIVLYILAKRTPVSWYQYFERDTGYFETREGLLRKRRRVLFSECEGRLVKGASYIGTIHYHLFLDCPGIGFFLLNTHTASGAERLLGYWSFLVQYMDNKKPLPDIKALDAYPDREPGLGSWQAWQEKEKASDFLDPYVEWQIQLKHNPQWDLSNYYMKPSARFWPIGKMLLWFFLFFLVLANLVWCIYEETIGFMSWEVLSMLLWLVIPFFIIMWIIVSLVSIRKHVF